LAPCVQAHFLADHPDVDKAKLMQERYLAGRAVPFEEPVWFYSSARRPQKRRASRAFQRGPVKGIKRGSDYSTLRNTPEGAVKGCTGVGSKNGSAEDISGRD
jgi:hypothetical protein